MSNAPSLRIEARARMAAKIDAVLFQDLGVDGFEKQRSVDWILDHIIFPEFEKLSGTVAPEVWCVMRMDDNGNEFVMQSGLSFPEATALAHQFDTKGHKQMYWVRRD